MLHLPLLILKKPFQPPALHAACTSCMPGPSCAMPKKSWWDEGSQSNAQSPVILERLQGRWHHWCPQEASHVLREAGRGATASWQEGCFRPEGLGQGGGYQKHPASAFPGQNSQNFHFKGNLETSWGFVLIQIETTFWNDKISCARIVLFSSSLCSKPKVSYSSNSYCFYTAETPYPQQSSD